MAIENKAALPSNKQGILFGLATGLSMVVYNVVLRVANIPNTSWLNTMVLAIYLIGVLWFCYAFARKEENDTSFAGMFRGGFRMVAIVVIILVANALLTNWVDPNYKKEIMTNNLKAFIAEKKTQPEIDAGMKLANDKFTQMILMKEVFTNIFYGVISVLIGAGIFRRNKI